MGKTKKKVLCLFAVVFILFIFVSLYFENQHNYTVKRHHVEETITFQNATQKYYLIYNGNWWVIDVSELTEINKII